MKKNFLLSIWLMAWISCIALPSMAQSVSGFTLVNADTDQDIGPLQDGDVLNLNELPATNLNVKANTDPSSVGSVVFSLNGSTYKTENVAPYALAGDNNGDYNAWTPGPGSYSLAATPYTETGGSGIAGTSLAISFEVVDDPDGGGETNIVYAINAGGGAYTSGGGINFSEDQHYEGGSIYSTSASIGSTNNDQLYQTERYGNFSYSFPVENGSYELTLYFAEIFWNSSGERIFDIVAEGQEMITDLDLFAEVGLNEAYKVQANVEVSDGSLDLSFQTDIDNAKLSALVVRSSEAPFPESPTVSNFTLVNADTDQDIGPLEDGDVLNLSELPTTNLNVRANTDPSSVGSVVFSLNGSTYNTENTAPYSLAGDNNGDYNAWTPNTGSYSLAATPYTETGGGGTAGTSLAISFEFEEDPDGGGDPGSGEISIAGELKEWHKITLSFEGPERAETDSDPNPFLDYRLDVTFTHSSTDKSYTFPGYFAVDGNAAETSATSGNIWRVHFRPDEVGEWAYTVSFRSGNEVAVSEDPNAGTPVSPIDGLSGSINIEPTDKSGDDFRARGLLQYVGEHYLQFAETGEYFVKGGPDSPENLLAYEDFDQTPDFNGYQKSYFPHEQDWNPGDPSWQGGKGTELIGALNYLASEGLNAISFLSMNINGDGENVYPYVSDSDLLHFDISKMDQWEIVFEHAQNLGLQMLIKLQETENDQLLDGGQLGVERKLYFRMLIAHYGHHLALTWNLGEENDIWQELNDPDNTLLKAYAEYIHENDPFQHHIVVHTFPGHKEEVYGPLLGNESLLSGASLQTSYTPYDEVLYWRQQSASAGRPWVVAADEIGSAEYGTPPDIGYTDPVTGETYDGSGVNISQDEIRKQVVWGTLMAGGEGVNLYFGYQLPQNDLNLEDFRSRDQMWDYVRHALNFWMNYVPFEQMEPDNSLVTNGWAFAQPGEVYVVYLPNGGSTEINLGSSGSNYSVSWYDPRNGGSLQQGSLSTITASGQVSVGNPPGESNQDWVVLLQNESSTSSTMARMGAEAEADEQSLQDIQYYPVPFKEQLSIQFSERKQEVEVRIISLSGKIAFRENVQDIQAFSIDTKSLPKGFYALRLIADGERISRKILKVE